jgi:hypothetical protein
MAAPREGGFKMSLGKLKSKLPLKASLAQKDTKRPRLALGDDEPDDSIKQQEISGWDAAEGGAVDIGGKKEKEAPRIIPALPNRNWRDEARRKQLANAPHTQAQNGVAEEREEPKVQYGLTILKKEEPQENGTEEHAAPAEPMEDVQDNLTEEQRLEKKALDALLNGKSTDNDLVIPVQSEEEAFRNDLREAPDAPSLEAYEATPIEGFGAALLRGMGWKDGEAIGKNGTAAKPKEVKRRPALLGIGAKEEAAVGVELGEWGGKGKGKKVTQSYNPVTLRNKVTGELISEEELKAKLEQQDMVQDERPTKERRRYSDDEEDERRREKRRDKREDGDRRRDVDYDSERRRHKDRKGDRRRDQDGDDYDNERRRDKRKDKYKEDDYDSERRREKRRDRDDEYDSGRRSDHRSDRKRRDRSRSPEDDKRERRRDRYRSRSRDSKRDRDRRDKSRDTDEKRKHSRRERNYDDDREDRKRNIKDGGSLN